MQISMWKQQDPGNEVSGAHFRGHLELELDLKLGQWLSRPVRYKFGSGTDDIVVMSLGGSF
jgi:hypothetical protein